jgi:hypothetical protein
LPVSPSHSPAPHEAEIPPYTGDIDADAWDLMSGKLAEEITGELS